MLDNLISQPVLSMSLRYGKFWNPVDHIDCQIETVNLVFHGQSKWCVDISLFFVASHMQVIVVCAPVGEFMNQPGIAMEIENDRLIGSKQTIEIAIRQTMHMFARGLQPEEINDIDEANLEVGEAVSQNGSCR